MVELLAAWRHGDGIQVHEQTAPGRLAVRFVQPGDSDWLAAVAALAPAEEGPMPAEASVAALQESAIAGLNRACGEVRQGYITVIPGQEMIYLAKEAEARAFVDSAAPDMQQFPMLAAEVGVTASTPEELAQVWLTMAGQWRQVAAAIERVRLEGARDIRAAATTVQVRSALAAALAGLANLAL